MARGFGVDSVGEEEHRLVACACEWDVQVEEPCPFRALEARDSFLNSLVEVSGHEDPHNLEVETAVPRHVVKIRSLRSDTPSEGFRGLRQRHAPCTILELEERGQILPPIGS